MTNKQIEELESKYLSKFYHFLKSFEEEMMDGFHTKEKIKNDWYGKYGAHISDFAVGAERIIYALFNGKGIGQPNSCPVGSDMFFEVKDAYIHIDLKTVQTRNIGDITKNIFVGKNQNNYKSEIKKSNGVSFNPIRLYEPALPTFYNKGKQNEKICLSFFITIVYEDVNLNILNINLLCMPNGELESHYGSKVLDAGKNPDKARFAFTKVSKFELLEVHKSRVKVIYFDKSMNNDFKKSLSFYERIFDLQSDS
ncbi:hypothetical protein G1K52_02955 [Tenacibaculum finnmarkense]|uniref:hypothetical protein n=1 Tax=Tenacibaculum finnmarkense TaxID=2781243 RepID=UPI001EFB6D05|nr:hypothetical protein [Tenacibaculum finnmarkense]MCG8784718.1 hypothetical protein [Tenacibaculum finnmarkense]